MDEKTLDYLQEIYRSMRVEPINMDDSGEAKLAQEMLKATHLELIKLARLGLWAEKHGIPALLEMDKIKGWEILSDSRGHISGLWTEALAALPKERE